VNVNASDLGSYFTLGTSNPTAITLREFTAHLPGSVNGLALPLALVAEGVVGLLILRRQKRRKSHAEET
jgi:hypothetical protein